MTCEVDVASAWRLARILRAHRIDVVHAHKGKGRTLALMAGLFVRIPVLILNRGVSFPLDRFQRLGYTTRRVTAIIAVCESIKRALVRSGVDGKKVEVIYSGTDTARFHPSIDGGPVRRELGFTPDDFVITQIGVRSWKGNDDGIGAMVWLEALAVAVPVVATDLQGNPELVTHGVTGLLVPPRRPDALARALLENIVDRPQACARAMEGRRRVEAKFSTAVKVERTEALYRR